MVSNEASFVALPCPLKPLFELVLNPTFETPFNLPTIESTVELVPLPVNVPPPKVELSSSLSC